MNVISFLKQKKTEIKVAALFLLVVALLGGAILWAWQDYLNSPPYVDPDLYPVRGIDVSSHNGMMNLDAAAEEGIEFIFIKASEGASFRDSNFRINYQKAARAGLKIGAYHFFRFDTDGVSQAINLLSAIGNRHLDIGIAVDIEQQGNPAGIPTDTIAERLSAMTEFLNLYGYRVTFYSNTRGYNDYLAANFQGFPLWICSFDGPPTQEGWTFWQFYHRGRVSGIRGDVDLNVFHGSRAEWIQFLKQQTSVRQTR